MASRVQCPECGTEFEPNYIGDIVFDRYFARLLLEVVKRTKTGTISWRGLDEGNECVKTSFVRNHFLASSMNNKNDGSRVHDLKCWGLLHQKPEWHHQGIYELTSKAVQFLRGQIEIPRKITVNKKSAQIIRWEGTTTMSDAIKDRWPGWQDFLNDWFTTQPPRFETGELPF